MNRTIHLSEFKFEEFKPYRPDHLKGIDNDTWLKCYNHLCKIDTRFNNRNGNVKDNELGLIEQYVHQSEFVPHGNMEDVLKWEFARKLNGEVSRYMYVTHGRLY